MAKTSDRDVTAKQVPQSAAQPLDQRRRQLLEMIDGRRRLGPEVDTVDVLAPDGSVLIPDRPVPRPNLTLAFKFAQHDEYQEKVLAIFGLMDLGVAPASRREEANRLLRFMHLGKWPALDQSWVVGQFSIGWNHRDRVLGVRIYMLYSGLLDPDIAEDFKKRLDFLVTDPFTQKSENIKFTHNSSIFLAHEVRERTSLPSFGAVRTWLVNELKRLGNTGMREWGTTYNAWTLSAVLNLADFARDEEVKQLATMVLDYFLARQSRFALDGAYTSGGVRRKFHWSLATTYPQTTMSQVLYLGGMVDPAWVEWAVTNYSPPKVPGDMYADWPRNVESRILEHRWRHRSYRGAQHAIATMQNIERSYYTTLDLPVSCYVQSAVGEKHRVIPYGTRPWAAGDVSLNEKCFGYQSLAIVQGGGKVKKAFTGQFFDQVPIRLFYSPHFQVDPESVEPPTDHGWAFLTDGEVFVAWAPTRGNPIRDPESENLSNPTKVGSWLKSTFTPGEDGEVAVLEVGDRDLYGDFESFQEAILRRNRRPRWLNDRLVYEAGDGTTIEFGTDSVKLNGVPVDLSDHPRCDMPGVQGFTITHKGADITFDFDNGTVQGNLERLPADVVWGSPPSGGPLRLVTDPSEIPEGQVTVPFTAVQLRAEGGTGTFVAWSPIGDTQLPPGLTLERSTGLISGTPTEAGTWETRIRVVDSDVATASRVFRFEIQAAPPLAVVGPPEVPEGIVKRPYGPVQFEAHGGTGTYIAWTPIGGTELPPGLNLERATGVLGGSPTEAGTRQTRIRVFDSAIKTASRVYTFIIHPPPPLAVVGPEQMPEGFVGHIYGPVQMVAEGGTGTYIAWVPIGGTELPPGLNLERETGIISGAPAEEGTFRTRIRVFDSDITTASRVYTFVINPPRPLAVVTPHNLPDGKVGEPYGPIQLEAEGGTGVYLAWTPIGGTELPPGLTVERATGIISGVPTTPGSYQTRIRVFDSDITTASRVFFNTIEDR